MNINLMTKMAEQDVIHRLNQMGGIGNQFGLDSVSIAAMAAVREIESLRAEIEALKQQVEFANQQYQDLGEQAHNKLTELKATIANLEKIVLEQAKEITELYRLMEAPF